MVLKIFDSKTPKYPQKGLMTYPDVHIHIYIYIQFLSDKIIRIYVNIPHLELKSKIRIPNIQVFEDNGNPGSPLK